MMIAVAGAGQHERRPLYTEHKKPMPRWMWAAIGVSIAVHAAGGAWLYYQRYEMPVEPTRADPPATTVTIWNPPEPEPTVDVIEPAAPPPPIHQPTQPPVAPPTTSPFTPPDTPTAPVAAGLPLAPVTPNPVVGGTGVEPTPPAPPSVIRNPQWVRQPSASQMERAYPRGAAADGVSGRAVLNCSVLASGEVANCTVTSETPQGEGFGRAALSLSRYFRLSPRTVDGQAVEGSRVNIPLTFAIG